jgi:hypothetical protein
LEDVYLSLTGDSSPVDGVGATDAPAIIEEGS